MQSPDGNPGEEKVGNLDIAGISPPQFIDKFRLGVNSTCSPNIYISGESPWLRFGFGSGCLGNANPIFSIKSMRIGTLLVVCGTSGGC